MLWLLRRRLARAALVWLAGYLARRLMRKLRTTPL